MTDKQIIIDGIDVSGCTNFTFNKIEPNESICISEQSTMCIKNKDCFYKRWQRKEQECDELKDKLNCCFCNPYIELNDIEKQRKCVEVTECFRRQLDQLKGENNELKDKNKQLTILGMNLNQSNEVLRKSFFATDKSRDNWREKAEKLEQTLTEIKEIAERDKEFCDKCDGDREIDCVDCHDGGRALLAQEILQKISECEVE